MIHKAMQPAAATSTRNMGKKKQVHTSGTFLLAQQSAKHGIYIKG